MCSIMRNALFPGWLRRVSSLRLKSTICPYKLSNGKICDQMFPVAARTWGALGVGAMVPGAPGSVPISAALAELQQSLSFSQQDLPGNHNGSLRVRKAPLESRRLREEFHHAFSSSGFLCPSPQSVSTVFGTRQLFSFGRAVLSVPPPGLASPPPGPRPLGGALRRTRPQVVRPRQELCLTLSLLVCLW